MKQKFIVFVIEKKINFFFNSLKYKANKINFKKLTSLPQYKPIKKLKPHSKLQQLEKNISKIKELQNNIQPSEKAKLGDRAELDRTFEQSDIPGSDAVLMHGSDRGTLAPMPFNCAMRNSPQKPKADGIFPSTKSASRTTCSLLRSFADCENSFYDSGTLLRKKKTKHSRLSFNGEKLTSTLMRNGKKTISSRIVVRAFSKIINALILKQVRPKVLKTNSK